MPTTFINRHAELSFLKRELSSVESKSRITILAAETGIGKSELSRRFLAEQAKRTVVRVEIPDSDPSNGRYIGRIAEEIDRLSEVDPRVDGVDIYQRMLPTPQARKLYNQNLLEEAVSSGPLRPFKPLTTIARRVSTRRTPYTRRFLRPADDSGFWKLYDYVLYNLSKGPSILSIDNLQSIDSLSRDFLYELAATLRSTYFLLEYTEGPSDTHGASALRDTLQKAGAYVAIHKVRWLPLRELLEANHAVNIRELLRRSYYDNNGNLRALQDLEILLLDSDLARPQDPGWLSDIDFTERNPTNLVLSSLRKQDVFLLCAICCHRGSVGFDRLRILYEVGDRFTDFHLDIDLSIERLRTLDLVVFSGTEVALSHDSIAKELLSDDRFQKYLAIGYSRWLQYYDQLFAASDFVEISKGEVLANLFHLCLHSDVDRLRSLLKEIRTIALNSKYPREITVYLEKLRIATLAESRQSSEPITYELLSIYYFAGLYEEAFQLLETLTKDDDRRFLYRVALLDRLDRHRSAVDEIETRLHNRQESGSKIELCLQLIRLTSYRSLNDLDSSKRVFQQIFDERRFEAYREYGYALRNAEILLPARESIAYLRKSVDHFNHHKDQQAAAYSLISLAMYLTLVGDLEASDRELGRADSLLKERFMERHMILNNRCVNIVYRNKAEAGRSLDSFRSCLRTAVTNFDKVVILNNLMVVATLSGEHSYANDVYESIRRLLETQPDRALHRTVFYNRSFYHRTLGDEMGAQRLLEKAKRTVQQHSPSWHFRLFGGSGNDCVDDEYRCRFPYHLSLITHWHFEIPSDLRG